MTTSPDLRDRRTSAARQTILAFATIAVLAGCSTSGVAASRTSTISAESAPQASGAACPPEDNGHPWVVFASPLESTDELTVGERGFVTTDAAVEDVVVSGDESSVRLAAGEFTEVSDCGRTSTTQHWLEISAVRPGIAKISIPRAASSGHWVITLTVER